MNVMPMHLDPTVAAALMYDFHLPIYTTDAAKVVCGVGHLLSEHDIVAPYAPMPSITYHGITKWAARTKGNYTWMLEYLEAMIKERAARGSDPTGRCGSVLSWGRIALGGRAGFEIPEGPLEPWYLAMDENARKTVFLNGHLSGFEMVSRAYLEFYMWKYSQSDRNLRWRGEVVAPHEYWPAITGIAIQRGDVREWYNQFFGEPGRLAWAKVAG